MTLLEQYEVQPKDVQRLVENYTNYANWTDELMESILVLFPR